MRSPLAAFGTLFLVMAAPTEASPRYKCEGYFQSWPCGTEYPNGGGSRRILSGKSRPVPKNTGLNAPLVVHQFRGRPLSAAVISAQFHTEKKSLGVWTGRVHGNGEVKLFLQIFRDQKLESTSSMGSTVLADQESSFTFRAALPKGDNWSYIILAHPAPVLE